MTNYCDTCNFIILENEEYDRDDDGNIICEVCKKRNKK